MSGWVKYNANQDWRSTNVNSVAISLCYVEGQIKVIISILAIIIYKVETCWKELNQSRQIWHKDK